MSGFSWCMMGSPFPIGALMKSRKSASGFEAQRFAALHVSITEPPPNARYESYWPCFANSIASLKLHATILFNEPVNQSICQNEFLPLNRIHEARPQQYQFLTCKALGVKCRTIFQAKFKEIHKNVLASSQILRLSAPNLIHNNNNN